MCQNYNLIFLLTEILTRRYTLTKFITLNELMDVMIKHLDLKPWYWFNVFYNHYDRDDENWLLRPIKFTYVRRKIDPDEEVISYEAMRKLLPEFRYIHIPDVMDPTEPKNKSL